MSTTPNGTHSLAVGYVLWIFGFLGSHRFYYGKTISGLVYLCTLGLLGIGWIIDLFLMPSLERQADRRFATGPWGYTTAWVLLTFLGIFGAHRFYMGKWATGLLYFFTGGLFMIGVGYDFCTLNQQLSERNLAAR